MKTTTSDKQAAFWQALSVALRNGLPLVKSLETMAIGDGEEALAAAVKAVSAEIRQGATFSVALRAQPKVFSKCEVTMVKAGESAGNLDVVLASLANAVASGHLPTAGATATDDQAALWRAAAELMRSGVPVIEILDLLLAEVVAEDLRPAVEAIRAAVLDGRKISHAMREVDGVFAAAVCEMVAVGEETGDLPNRLAAIADGIKAGVIAVGGTAPSPAAEFDADAPEQAPVAKVVSLIIREAARRGASDIHLQPEQTTLRVRYRIDGVLHETEAPPKHLQQYIVRRLKIMAGADPAETRMSQDGRILMDCDGRSFDLRCNFLPTAFGERIVLRLLDPGAVQLSLDRVGLADSVRLRLAALAKRPHGLVLVTGPAGSGKTTLMYSMLREVADSTNCVFTVEDPVEYVLANTAQVAVNPHIGLTFERVLRAMLRQDPDVIMIGEIRDLDTLQVAVQAAITGHLIIAGLHAPDTAAAVRRLLDLGLEPFLFTSTVVGVASLRLPRTLCRHCRREMPPGTIDLSDLGAAALSDHPGPVFYGPGGCDKCGNTGYRGRSTLQEILEPGEAVQAAVAARASADQIRSAAVAAGLRTLAVDGLRQAADGVTSIAEVLRVAPDAADLVQVTALGSHRAAASGTPPPQPEQEPVGPATVPAAAAAVSDETQPAVVRVVSNIICTGIESRASDIHIDPGDGIATLRYRVDGILRELLQITPQEVPEIVNRIKAMAGLNIAERRLPQDGRMSLRVADRPYDLRVSAIPVVHGERVVMRILDPHNLSLELSDTGILDRDLDRVQDLCAARSGVIIVNGPTGCGKTTLLYAMLNSINTADRNIMTVEDPVEFYIAGLSQARVNAGVGFTFPVALKALLRQAPDVVMVGELRDLQTANLVMQAGMSGLLVMTTLHASTSVGAVLRLRDMGVKPFMLNAALDGIITQRLVRRLCAKCREQVSLPSGLPDDVAAELAALGIERAYRSSGCDKCHGGYRGRMAIHEVLVVDQTLRNAIAAGAGAAQLSDLASAAGMQSMRQCGLTQAGRGLTSIEEVLRVAPTSDLR